MFCLNYIITFCQQDNTNLNWSVAYYFYISSLLGDYDKAICKHCIFRIIMEKGKIYSSLSLATSLPLICEWNQHHHVTPSVLSQPSVNIEVTWYMFISPWRTWPIMVWNYHLSSMVTNTLDQWVRTIVDMTSMFKIDEPCSGYYHQLSLDQWLIQGQMASSRIKDSHFNLESHYVRNKIKEN